MTHTDRRTPPAAGWYPSGPGLDRYFDGRQWTMYTRPSAQSVGGALADAGSKPQKRRSGRAVTTLVTIGIFLFALCAGGYAILSGQQIKTIEGGKIEFYANDREYSSQDIADKQPAMQERVDSAQQAAAEQRDPVETSLPDVSGSWSGNSGYTYSIQQYGNQLVFQEQSPYGVTTVGQGSISGRRVDFRWQAFNGMTGTLSMTISPGADVMQGTLQPVGYPSQPFEMRRPS